MKVIFRADASFQIGTGHIMRCLTLADELREKGVEVFFICRLLPGNLCGFVEQKGYPVHRLPYPGQPTDSVTHHTQLLGVNWQADAEETKTILKKDAGGIDWLVVDHYALDIRWETQLRPYTKKIMVIDDLADRPHDCDLLLDQNLYENMETRYQPLIPGHCLALLGPEYVLLRPEFKEVRRNLRQRDGTVKRILIFFGGSDPTNETAKALKAIQIINCPEVVVDVVVGSTNIYKEEIQQLCSARPNTCFYCQVENMAELMAVTDLVIGAGGTATWERCFLGLPSMTLIVAGNQADVTKAVAAKGAAWNLGWNEMVRPEILADLIKMAMSDPVVLRNMGLNAMQLMGEVLFNKENPVVQTLLEDKNAMV